MQREDLFQLSQILRPALAAAHDALQPGPRLAAGESNIASALALVLDTDRQLTEALRAIQDVIGGETLNRAKAMHCASTLEVAFEELASAVSACAARGHESDRRWSALAAAGHDVQVVYAHFLAQLVQTIARPDEIANGYIEFSCQTNLPKDLGELEHWQAGHFLYDQQQSERALRLRQARGRPIAIAQDAELDAIELPSKSPLPNGAQV
jgi:hypothetical protein